MTITSGSGNFFNSQKIEVSSMAYSKSGDTYKANLSKPIFSSDTYAKKHFLVSGAFRVDYPGTDYPSQTFKVGDIWPLEIDGVKNTDRFNVVALEDNSVHHCIRTYNTKKIDINIISGVKESKANLVAGKVYIASVPVEINQNTVNPGIVIAPESDKVATLLSSGKIYELFSIPADPDSIVDTVQSGTL